MRLKRASLLAYAVMVVLAVAVAFAGTGNAAVARLFALQPARADQHLVIGEGQTCASCHTSTHRPPLTGACEACHVTQDWRSTSHRHATKWLDEGGHEGVACSRCHRRGTTPKSNGCSTCHSTARHARSDDCGHCHNVESWGKSHVLPVRHPVLAGAHAKAACPDCHTLHSAGTTWSCKGCHAEHTKDFRLEQAHKKPGCIKCHSVSAARDNLNKVAVRGTDCEGCHRVKHRSLTDCRACHTPTSFKKSTFDHSKTEWKLVGGHEKLACDKCHRRQQWADSNGKTCVDCHGARHGGLTDCERCHTTSGFARTTFLHSTTDLKLTGVHATLACEKCHPQRRWTSSKGTKCVSCHGTRHGGLKDCANCHTTTGFTPARFDHGSSGFRLSGAHTKVACDACHPKSRWTSSKGTTCVSCHGTRHGGQTDCARCHTNAAFKPSTFRHQSVWRIDGAHASLACEKCHAGEAWGKVKGTNCAACHGTKHGGQVRCDRCHTTTSWIPLRPVKHTPRYPLTGAHRYVDCIACHPGPKFSGTPTSCYSCHADLAHCEHKDCERCHTTESWRDIKPHEMLPHEPAPAPTPEPPPSTEETHSHDHEGGQ